MQAGETNTDFHRRCKGAPHSEDFRKQTLKRHSRGGGCCRAINSPPRPMKAEGGAAEEAVNGCFLLRCCKNVSGPPRKIQLPANIGRLLIIFIYTD